MFIKLGIIKVGKLSSIYYEKKEVTQTKKVVFSAWTINLKGLNARKHQITSEVGNFLVLQMISSLVQVSRNESIVDQLGLKVIERALDHYVFHF